MVKKIFLFLIFFLSIFLLPKQNALAVSCAFDITTPLVKDITQFDISISSNKALSPGASFYVQYEGAAFESAGPSIIDEKTTDSNGNIIYTKTTGSGHLSTGTFKVYVYKKESYGKPGATYECASNDFTVNDNTLGGTCAINVTSANSNRFSTADAVNFNVTFIDKQNDSRKVWVYRNGNLLSNSQFPSFHGENCQSIGALQSGFSLGQLSADNYSIRVGDVCWAADPNKGCPEKPFIITPEGGTPPTANVPCNACPANCTFSGTETAPACVKASNAPSGTTCTVITQYCNEKTQVCDPGHVYGCMGGGSGSPGGGGIIGGPNWVSPTPVCKPNLGGNGNTCETAIGNVQTSAAGFVNSIMSLILSLVGGIAVILIIISGYRLMVSQGNPENLKSAKDQLTAAIIGLLFVIFALVFLSVIGVNILGLPGFKQ